MIINHSIKKLETDTVKCRFPAILEKQNKKFPSDMLKISKKFFLQKIMHNFINSFLPSINDWNVVPAQLMILSYFLHLV